MQETPELLLKKTLLVEFVSVSVCSKQLPPAKSDLPCSSQKKVIWTLKMVAGLFLPSNNHSSFCHWKTLNLREFCLDNIYWGKGCKGSCWHLLGPKAPTKLSSLLGLTQARTFSYLMSAQRESWFKGFFGGSKIELFYPYFCIHKINWLLSPMPKVPRQCGNISRSAWSCLCLHCCYFCSQETFPGDRFTPGKEYIF